MIGTDDENPKAGASRIAADDLLDRARLNAHINDDHAHCQPSRARTIARVPRGPLVIADLPKSDAHAKRSASSRARAVIDAPDLDLYPSGNGHHVHAPVEENLVRIPETGEKAAARTARHGTQNEEVHVQDHVAPAGRDHAVTLEIADVRDRTFLEKVGDRPGPDRGIAIENHDPNQTIGMVRSHHVVRTGIEPDSLTNQGCMYIHFNYSFNKIEYPK